MNSPGAFFAELDAISVSAASLGLNVVGRKLRDQWLFNVPRIAVTWVYDVPDHLPVGTLTTLSHSTWTLSRLTTSFYLIHIPLLRLTSALTSFLSL